MKPFAEVDVPAVRFNLVACTPPENVDVEFVPVTLNTPATVDVPLAVPCKIVPFAAPIEICCNALIAVDDAYGSCDATVALVALKLAAVGEEVATTFP